MQITLAYIRSGLYPHILLIYFKVKTKRGRRVTIKVEKYQDADEFFKDQDFTSSEESSTESDNEDVAFRATPLHKRIRQERKSLGPGFLTKRKRVNQDSDSDCADESITKRKINSPPGACFSCIVCL